MSINKVILLARLGGDPELKYLPTGAAVCNFSVATSERWTDKESGQKQEKTEWSRIVVWGKLAELCNQYLSKGRQVYIEGKLATRSWEKEDGTKAYVTEIVAQTVQFIGGNPNAEDDAPAAQSKARPQGQAPLNQGQPQDAGANFTADDIPF